MVLTGMKRRRGTRSASAPSKTPIAAPIAVSSWITGGEDLSPGSTVLRLTISGSPSTGPRSAQQRVERLQVDPQVVGVEEAVAVDVLEGVEVFVGRLGDLAQDEPAAGGARCPPFRSAGVRSMPSEANGAPDVGEPGEDARVELGPEVVHVGDEGVAVALRRAAARACRRSAARCRGRRGRAGTTRAPGRAATRRRQVVGEELGLLVLDEVERDVGLDAVVLVERVERRRRGSRRSSSAPAAAAPRSGRAAPSTCSAITSRKVRPSLTSSSDFGPVMPMLVPRPPLSLITTAWSMTSGRVGLRQVVVLGQPVERLERRPPASSRSRPRPAARSSAGRSPRPRPRALRARIFSKLCCRPSMRCTKAATRTPRRSAARWLTSRTPRPARFAGRRAHRRGAGRIAHERVDGLGQGGQIRRRHEQAGLAIDHDLGDAADRAGDDRRAAGHRLQVDDPERLVDRGAAEDRRVRVELDHRRPRRPSPADPLARRSRVGNRRLPSRRRSPACRARPRRGRSARPGRTRRRRERGGRSPSGA